MAQLRPDGGSTSEVSTDDARFSDCLQALLRAVPRTKSSGKWNVAEAELLDRLVTTCFPDLEIPPDPLDITEQQLFSPDD